MFLEEIPAKLLTFHFQKQKNKKNKKIALRGS